jgi:hypothetical protein
VFSRQYVSPPSCGSREQVELKVLGGLLPPYPVAALLSMEEHLSIGEGFLQAAQSFTPNSLLFLPPSSAALVSRLAALLARHIGIRASA